MSSASRSRRQLSDTGRRAADSGVGFRTKGCIRLQIDLSWLFELPEEGNSQEKTREGIVVYGARSHVAFPILGSGGGASRRRWAPNFSMIVEVLTATPSG